MPTHVLEDLPTVLIYARLWRLVESVGLLDELVIPRNRIRFDQNETQPTKPHVSAADMPELVLAPEGMVANLTSSSGSAKADFSYMWLISTGDYRYAHYLAPVTWALFTGLSRWCDSEVGLHTLLWNNKRFVLKLEFNDSSDGLADPERNRGLQGWSSLMRFTVHCNFSLTDLKKDC